MRVILTCYSGTLDQLSRQDEGVAYCTGGRNGDVLAAKPAFELLATNDLETRGMFSSSPAVAGGHFYIRSDKFLYCIGAK